MEQQRRHKESRGYGSVNKKLGSERIVCDNKVVFISVYSNEQGGFLNIFSQNKQNNRRTPRVIIDKKKFKTLKNILASYLEDFEPPPPASNTKQSRSIVKLKTASFRRGLRQYYIDLCLNADGKFLKITMLSGPRDAQVRRYVVFPFDIFPTFFARFCRLLDTSQMSQSSNHMLQSSSVVSLVSRRSSCPALSQSSCFHSLTQNSLSQYSTSSEIKLDCFRKINAVGKAFYFGNITRNNSGTYSVCLSEVEDGSGKEISIDIPESCWLPISEVFSQLNREMDDIQASDMHAHKYVQPAESMNGFFAKAYDEPSSDFEKRMQKFWQILTYQKKFPSLDKKVVWQVFWVHAGYYSHYSLVFKPLTDDVAYDYLLVDLRKVDDNEKYKVYLNIGVFKAKKASLHKVSLDRVKMSGHQILSLAYERLKKMGDYNAYSNNCQTFSKLLAEDIGLKNVGIDTISDSGNALTLALLKTIVITFTLLKISSSQSSMQSSMQLQFVAPN